MTTAEEQHRRSEALALRLEGGALAQEAAEGREPRARPDHDDRRRRIDRQAETPLGLLDEGFQRAAGRLARQVAGADVHVDARAVNRLSLAPGLRRRAARAHGTRI